ncbi:hypothetical protein MMC10_007981 [Thelotrema lepadinum]|nr:hypothetical protein [Thelotrema lepadinum]
MPSKTPSKPTPKRSQTQFTNMRHVFGPKSKLNNVDLTNFFLSPAAWELLTDDQRKHLKDRLPPHISYDESGRPSFEFLKYDMNWKSDLRLFKEDLADGKYEPEWLMEAQQAMEDRAAGKFDAWKLQKFEEHWGQKLEFSDHEFSGALDEVLLEHLTADGAFREGDVWFYTRSFGRGKSSILMEHNAQLLEIDDYGKLKFLVHGGDSITTEKRSIDKVNGSNEDQASLSGRYPKIPKLGGSDKAYGVGGDKDSVTDNSDQLHPPDNGEMDIDKIPSVHVLTNAGTTSYEATFEQKHHATVENSSNHTPKDPDAMSIQAPSEHIDNTSINNVDSARPYNTRRHRVAPEKLDPSHEVKPKAPPTTPRFPITMKIDSPEQLEKNIILADGRRKWDTRTGSWKRFYCKRDGKDIGSLFSFRENYWLRMHGKAPSKA